MSTLKSFTKHEYNALRVRRAVDKPNHRSITRRQNYTNLALILNVCSPEERRVFAVTNYRISQLMCGSSGRHYKCISPQVVSIGSATHRNTRLDLSCRFSFAYIDSVLMWHLIGLNYPDLRYCLSNSIDIERSFSLLLIY